jgi:hypothetical protein
VNSFQFAEEIGMITSLDFWALKNSLSAIDKMAKRLSSYQYFKISCKSFGTRSSAPGTLLKKLDRILVQTLT